MGAQLRAIRRRIRSVQSTMKITRAMELIAASQIRRAQQRVQQARPYAEEIKRAIGDITGQAEGLDHPLLEVRPEPKAAAVFVVTSDGGLAGAYSANVLRRAEELLTALRDEGEEPKVYVTGKKEIADTLIEAFIRREVDEIYGVYTDFVSAMTQRAEARQFIPMIVEEVEIEEAGPYPLYLFEPSPQVILDQMLPRYVEM